MGNLNSHETMQILQSDEVKHLARQLGNFFRHHAEYQQHRRHKSRNKKRDKDADDRAQARIINNARQPHHEAYAAQDIRADRRQGKEHHKAAYPYHERPRSRRPSRMAQDPKYAQNISQPQRYQTPPHQNYPPQPPWNIPNPYNTYQPYAQTIPSSINNLSPHMHQALNPNIPRAPPQGPQGPNQEYFMRSGLGADDAGAEPREQDWGKGRRRRERLRGKGNGGGGGDGEMGGGIGG